MTGAEIMTPELQERLGQHIYRLQGTGAWEGYKGPSDTPVFYDGNGEAATWNDVGLLGVGDGRTDQTRDEMIDPVDPNAPKAYESFWEEVGAQFKSTSITAHIDNWMSEGQFDPTYKPSDMFSEDEIKAIPEQYRDYLLNASSMENAKTRLQWVEEDQVRQARLNADGANTVSSGLVAGVLDPIPLAVGILTGGVGTMARAGFLARAAAGAVNGAVSGAALDGAVGYLTDDPYADPVQSAVWGGALGALGGILSGSKATADVGQEMLSSANKMARSAAGRPVKEAPKVAPQAAPEVPAAAITNDHSQSMGAMVNHANRETLIPYLGPSDLDIADEAVPHGFGGKLNFSVGGQMVSSSNPLVRLVGFNLVEAAAGASDHSVTPHSVNAVQKAVQRQLEGNLAIEYQAARMAYLSDAGIGSMNLVARAKANKEFARLVYNGIEETITPADQNKHVARAIAAHRKMTADVAALMNEVGLTEELNANPHYVPKIADHDRIAEFDNLFGDKTMEKALAEAILAKAPTMPVEIVERMAKGYWMNIRKAALGYGNEADRAIATGNRAEFMRAFKEGLSETEALTDEQIEIAYGILRGEVEAAALRSGGDGIEAHGQSRLKKRTLLDYNHEMNVETRHGTFVKFRVNDLFSDDVEAINARYIRSQSGAIAFAQMQIKHPTTGAVLLDGIRGSGDLTKLKDIIAESYRQMGKPLAEYQGEMEAAFENIDFLYNKINGYPMPGQNNWAARAARRIKEMQFARLMSNMGLNQIQETWKFTALLGVKATIQQMPAISHMVKGVHTGEFVANDLIGELVPMTGIGLDGLAGRAELQLADERLSSPAVGKFGRGVDNALTAASDFTSRISLMRVIQDYQQRWALGAIAQRMADLGRRVMKDGVADFSKISKHEWNRLASMGLSKEGAERLFRDMLAHGTFDGSKLMKANHHLWDPKTVSDFRYFVGRYADRLVQQNDYGALAKWMSNPVLSMFVQFRSFVFGAWAKSTLWSIHHGGFTDPRMMVLLLGEIAAGTATYMLRQSPNLVNEEKREKFLEEATPTSVLLNGWARSATSSLIPSIVDSTLKVAETMDIGPGPIFGQTRSSGSATDAFFGAPLMDQGAALATGLRGVKQSVFDGEEMSQSEITSLLRSTPLPTNYMPFMAALGALIGDRPLK